MQVKNPRNIVQQVPSNITQVKNPVYCCLNIPGTTINKQKPCAVLPETQDNLALEKICMKCYLNTARATLYSKNSCAS